MIERGVTDRTGRVLILDRRRNPDRVDPDDAQAGRKIGEISCPVVGIIVVPIIPPETLEHDLAIPGIRGDASNQEAAVNREINGYANSHQFTCSLAADWMQSSNSPSYGPTHKPGSGEKPVAALRGLREGQG